MSPTWDEIDKLEPRLAPGEQRVLDFFNRTLPPDWQVYTKPNLNGLRPDFVLLHPDNGIALFYVDDSPLGQVKDAERHRIILPFARAVRCKSEIADIYCPSMDTPNHFGLITTGVIFLNARRGEIDRLLPRARVEKLGFSRKHPDLYPVATSEDLSKPTHEAVFPRADRPNCLMSFSVANELRSWLLFPEFDSHQGDSYDLDEYQRGIAWDAVGARRRVTGPAGSGKSLVLAHRAVRLAIEGKSVLVVTFNITMLHYLRHLAVQAAVSYPSGSPGLVNQVDWLNYHEWAKRICVGNGYEREYHALWDYGNDAHNQGVMNRELPKLVDRVLRGDVERYDAVLVDEGQDFRLDWWQNLRQCVKGDDSSMLFVADFVQDVYGTGKLWRKFAMKQFGFRGRWNTLRGSYRLPHDMIRPVREFAVRFLGVSKESAPTETPEPSNGPKLLRFRGTTVRWINVNEEESMDACVREMTNLAVTFGNSSFALMDMVFLASGREDGLEFVQRMSELNYRIHHTFVRIPDEPAEARVAARYQEQRKKLTFLTRTWAIRATTLLSFKGWESAFMVIQLSSRDDPEARAAIYTALTRLKRRRNGSYITVVSSWAPGAEYGKTWESDAEKRRAGVSGGPSDEPPL